MIVDTSAVLALVLDEPRAAEIDAALQAAPTPRMSAATWVELFTVVDRRLSPQQRRRILRLLDAYGVRVEPFTAEQAVVAAQAMHDFGKGSGHAAGLDLGDTFSYALASVRDEPLLYVGNDFTHTDLVPALPRQQG